MTIKKVSSIAKLEDLGRIQLSKSFFMRDFLYSEIANWYGVPNFPDHPEIAIRHRHRTLRTTARTTPTKIWTYCHSLSLSLTKREPTRQRKRT